MSSTFRCPSCNTMLRLPESVDQDKFICPRCQVAIDIPEVEEVRPQPPEKYCVECGARIRLRAVVCPECGVSQTDSTVRKEKFCHECGEIIRGRAAVCPKCGVEQECGSASIYRGRSAQSIKDANSIKILAGIFGILLGGFGVHKFILGFTQSAVIMLVVSLVGSCLYGLGFLVMMIIGLIEGIMYLTKSDEDFYRIYIVGKREWF